MTLLCYAANVSLAAGVSHYPVLLTSISADFSLNAEEAGQASSFLYIGLIVSCVVLTPLAAKFGEKIAMLCCLMSTSLACIGEAISANYSILCGAMFLQGLGSGGLEFLLSPIIASMYRDSGNVTAKLSMLHSFFPIGTIGTSLFATVVMSWAGWRVVPMLIALLPALVLIATARENFPLMGGGGGGAGATATEDAAITAAANTANGDSAVTINLGGDAGSPSSPSKDESMALAPASEMSLVSLLENRTFWFICVLVIVFGMCEQGPSVWLPDFVQGGLGFSESTSGYSLTLYSLFMSVIRVVAGRYGADWNPYWILIICGSLQFLFTLAAVMLPSPWMAYGAATLTGCGVSLLWPTTLSIAAMQLPTGGTKMFGILAALANVGDTLMAITVGWVADESKSMKYAFAAGMAPGLLMAAMSFISLRCVMYRQRRFLRRRKAHMSTDDMSGMGRDEEDVAGGGASLTAPPDAATLTKRHPHHAVTSLSPPMVSVSSVELSDVPVLVLTPSAGGSTHPQRTFHHHHHGESPRNDTAVREHLPAAR